MKGSCAYIYNKGVRTFCLCQCQNSISVVCICAHYVCKNTMFLANKTAISPPFCP